MMNEDVLFVLHRRMAVREPLKHRFVLRRTDERHAAGPVQGPVSIGEAVCDPEWRRRRRQRALRWILRDKPIAILEVDCDDLARACARLPRSDEPPMTVSSEQLLALAVAGERELVERLHAVRFERGIYPPPAR